MEHEHPRTRNPGPAQETASVDLLVFGGGAEASLLAAALAAEGWSVLLLEPRGTASAISAQRLTGLAAQTILELSLGEEMASRRFPRAERLQILGRNAEECFEVPMSSAAWHVRKADLEQVLLRHALSRGVIHRRGQALRPLTEGSRVVGLVWEPASVGRAPERQTRCSTLVDASGSEAFLSRQAIAGPRTFGEGQQQVQVQGLFRADGVQPGVARLFHDGPGHWASWTPLSTELVAVSVAVPQATYQRFARTPAQLLAWGLESIHPELQQALGSAAPAGDVELERLVPYRVEPRAGEGWLCLGAAHRKGDPVLDLELLLAMAEASDVAATLREAPTRRVGEQVLEGLVARAEAAWRTAAELTSYFWRSPGFFRQLVQGRLGSHFLDLLEGRSLLAPEPEVLRVVRGNLTARSLEGDPDLRAEAIAHRVRTRCSGDREVEAAFLELGENGALLSLIVGEGAQENLLHDFEESLYAEFGREFLVVLRWSAAEGGALSAPDFPGARRIFDRRAS
ncbi:MAG: hypothetical protein P1V51_02975 [Deltaproteobacteria bacterium]|nr:hypothetical protein [Deltaproteobacteria bacterium]